MDLGKSLKIDSVDRLQPVEPVILSPQDTVAHAVDIMQSQNLTCVLICDDGRLVGIFTERDLLKRVLGRQMDLTSPLRDCMTAQPVTVQRKDPVGAAVQRMEEGGYRNLPVVDDDGRPLGVLTVKRIIHYLVEHFPTTVHNLPPDPDAVQKDREGA